MRITSTSFSLFLDSQAKELEAKKFEILSSNYKSFLAANQFLVDLQEKLAVIVPGRLMRFQGSS